MNDAFEENNMEYSCDGCVLMMRILGVGQVVGGVAFFHIHN